MIKYLFVWISCLMACFQLQSCSDTDWDGDKEKNALELTVNCTPAISSRVTEDGEANYNENLIKTLHYFFYREGQTSQNAVMSGTVVMAEGGVQNQAIIRVQVNENELNNTLFPRPYNKCEVYIIANLPEEVQLPTDNTSIDNLKATIVETAFNESVIQPSFIMDGQAVVTLGDRNLTSAASANIQLDRLASKLTLCINVEESIAVNGQIWTPDLSQLKLTLKNVANQTTIGGEMKNSFFNYNTRTVPDNQTTELFYSYSREWDFRDEDALAFFIDLPWSSQKNGTTVYEHCYYKVLLNTFQLERNNWYHMNLTIGVLGSYEEETPVTMAATYKVMDWADGLNMNANLLGARYLVVNENYFELNNEDELEIPFATSHACKIESITVTRPIFGTTQNSQSGTETLNGSSWISLDNSNNVIRFNHELVDMGANNKDYDFAPYTITFRLCHADSEFSGTFYEDFTIVQYPVLFIVSQRNSGDANSQISHGYQYVNGQRGNNAPFGGAPGPIYTNNPYMYVITTTVLASDSEYFLGDPRASTTYTVSDAASAPSVQGGNNRTLSNYYPTIGDATVENMISPKFRIASSYSICQNNISYESAKKRCATYQEDGYPAGRWRMPTMGEVKFVIRLSVDEKIPALFSSGMNYWCANGTIAVETGSYDTSTSTTGEAVIRCVYDEWYWERMEVNQLPVDQRNTFTWGDEQE